MDISKMERLIERRIMEGLLSRLKDCRVENSLYKGKYLTSLMSEKMLRRIIYKVLSGSKDDKDVELLTEITLRSLIAKIQENPRKWIYLNNSGV